ncbi:MAG: STAS domain-containing protein [Myxococcales bacterium]|nr:STAS domain-containing protein [Myxococcales bacterium]
MSDEDGALEDELARERARLETFRLIRATLFEDSRDGVCIVSADGSVELNATAEAMLSTVSEPGDDWQESWGFFRLDGSRCEASELPGFLALSGAAVPTQIVQCVSPDLPEGVYLSIDARPFGPGRSISVFQDVSAQFKLESKLEERGRQLAASEAENAALVERLRLAIDQIATPILRVAKDVLVMPIIGVLDAARSARAAERLLHEVSSSGARWVIVDVTGVEIIDTTTADLFSKVTRAVELLGCRAAISGMRPAVARTLIELGISMDGLPSYRNLRHALEAALAESKVSRRRRRRREEVRA